MIDIDDVYITKSTRWTLDDYDESLIPVTVASLPHKQQEPFSKKNKKLLNPHYIKTCVVVISMYFRCLKGTAN